KNCCSPQSGEQPLIKGSVFVSSWRYPLSLHRLNAQPQIASPHYGAVGPYREKRLRCDEHTPWAALPTEEYFQRPTLRYHGIFDSASRKPLAPPLPFLAFQLLLLQLAAGYSKPQCLPSLLRSRTALTLS